MISTDPIFVDATGNNYLIRDVCAAGDCALLALLMSPTFEAPVSGADELRRAIVSFARGEARDDCSTVFSLIGKNSSMTFDGYLSQVLQPKFWVGTIAFIWTSMAYGIDIVSHFLMSTNSLILIQQPTSLRSTCQSIVNSLIKPSPCIFFSISTKT
jgi:hypothetical protein